MKEKTFIIGFVSCVLMFISSFVLIAWFVPAEMYMDGEYAAWSQQREYCSSKAEGEEVLFLGDSRMKADILPELVGKSVYNLALGGGTSLEMYYSLKNYIDNHHSTKMVIVAFGPVHYTLMDCYQSRNWYFHYLSQESAFEAQYNVFEKDNVDDINQKKILKEDYEYFFRLPTKYSGAILKSMLSRKNDNSIRYNKIESEKGHMQFGTRPGDDGLDQEAKSEKFIEQKSIDFYMRELIKLCKDNNIIVCVEQLPMNQSSYSVIKENGYLDDYRQYMLKLSTDMGVYVNLDIPCYDNKYFGDPTHLNMSGTEKFSKEMKEKYKL